MKCLDKGQDEQLKLLSLLFHVVLRDVAREDLSSYLLQEVAKALKKESLTGMLPNIVSLLAAIELTHHGSDLKGLIFSAIVTLMYQLWTDQLLRHVKLQGFAQVLIPSLTTLLEPSKSHDSKDHLLFQQLWLVICGYLHGHSALQSTPQLVALAERTPNLVYMSEFSLMLRLGGNKEVVEGFIDMVYQRFPAIYEMPEQVVH